MSKSFLFLTAMLLSSSIFAVSTIQMYPGDSVTLTPGEPITAFCNNVSSPNAKPCYVKACNTSESAFKIVDETGANLFILDCFRTLQEVREGLSILRSTGQCR